MTTSPPASPEKQSSPPSLDKSKFDVESPSGHTPAQEYAMPGMGRYREAACEAMIALDWPSNTVDRFSDCCRHAAVLEQDETKKLKVIWETCGSRYCPHCKVRYQAHTAFQLEANIGIVFKDEWRFITLTLRSSDDLLHDQLDHLAASFRRLRQANIWRKSQMYGWSVVEVTYNTKTNQWHPHLHVIVRGRYVNQAGLSASWYVASGGSKIVDIRSMRSGPHASKYVAKYLGKCPIMDDVNASSAMLMEYLDAMRARKLIVGFGPKCIEEFRECGDDLITEEPGWTYLASLADLLRRRNAGDHRAIFLLDKLARGSPDLVQMEMFSWPK